MPAQIEHGEGLKAPDRREELGHGNPKPMVVMVSMLLQAMSDESLDVNLQTKACYTAVFLRLDEGADMGKER